MKTFVNPQLTQRQIKRQSRQIALLPAVALLILVATSLGVAQDRDTYAIGLWGDLPYSTTQATIGVPNLIADMNSQDLAFTAHDGDLKSGSSECTDSVYTQALGYFNSLHAPAVFTPGDNDWTDCDRTAGYNSLAQLDKERALFFSTPFTLGQRRLRQEVQTTPTCLGVSGYVPCVENRRWTKTAFTRRKTWRPAGNSFSRLRAWTDGALLRGVRFFGEGTRTSSVIMTKGTGKVRFVDSIHLENRPDIRIRFA